MRIVCQQTILMKYHALLVIYEKAVKFEIIVCCKLWVALYGLTLFFNSSAASDILLLAYNICKQFIPCRVAQLVMCLATDACLTADPGVASWIPAGSHTLVEIDCEIVSMVIPLILLPSAELFKKGCCQLQAKVCAWSTG